MLVRHLPRESATVRAVHGDAAHWGAAEQLMAHTADLLAVANWQRGGDRSAARPTPIPRPGVEDRSSETFGSKPRPIDEMRRILDDWHGRGGEHGS